MLHEFVAPDPVYLNKRNLKTLVKQLPPNEMSFAAFSLVQGGKRRGRKRERDDLYFQKANERIIRLRKTLETAKEDGFTVK